MVLNLNFKVFIVKVKVLLNVNNYSKRARLANIFLESWNETVDELKRVMPENIKEQLSKNKYKYIAVVVFLLALEFGLAAVIWSFVSQDSNTKPTVNTTTTIKDVK